MSRGGRRAGAGRPPDSATGERRTVRIILRLTESEHERYAAAAEAEGCGLAEWLRDAAEERCR